MRVVISRWPQRIAAAAGVLLLVAVVLSACSGVNETENGGPDGTQSLLPSEIPGVYGIIKTLNPTETPETQDDGKEAAGPDTPVSSDDRELSGNDGRLGSMLVEGSGNEAAYDAARVTVTEDTNIFLRQGTDDEDADFSRLREGDQVKVWFRGAVNESYPVQGTASHILILAD